ncbi:ABC transporter permease subunit [Kribbella sandramycini]|uniref:ABC transporter permease subunit n=1 Tax=Kribbella sandramycini TaxID=60450 RepID=A0A7Y4L739_9ACTN|nr:ABC transporter permease subunit [Kribbella sandramycini]MBB6568825.1 ABC-2 type transport system permease protein [Kribbella sandramycini]NOL45594.1 ABC transporter permease subunit [Kribbella sandramycini]
MSPSSAVAEPVAPAARPGRYPLALFRSELQLVFGRARTWVLLAVLAGVPLLIGIAIKLSGSEGGGEGFIGQVAGNGLFLIVASLGLSLPFFLPTAVTVIAGESLAGESSLGTLRNLLTAPAGRSRLLAAKMVALIVFCLAATLTIWLSGLIVGFALFPVGDVLLLSGTTIPLGEGLLRALGIAVVIALSLLGLAGIGLFVSSLTSTPLAAMAATFGTFIVLGILTAIPQIDVIHPWLLMFRWTSFADLLRDPPYWGAIGKNLLLQAGYLTVFYAAAWARITSRDIV